MDRKQLLRWWMGIILIATLAGALMPAQGGALPTDRCGRGGFFEGINMTRRARFLLSSLAESTIFAVADDGRCAVHRGRRPALFGQDSHRRGGWAVVVPERGSGRYLARSRKASNRCWPTISRAASACSSPTCRPSAPRRGTLPTMRRSIRQQRHHTTASRSRSIRRARRHLPANEAFASDVQPEQDDYHPDDYLLVARPTKARCSRCRSRSGSVQPGRAGRACVRRGWDRAAA